MLTISIIFAVLVALWGFSGTIAAQAKHGLASAKLRVRPEPQSRPAAASRTRGTRPVASA